MWDWAGPLLAQGGIFGLAVWAGVKLHTDAVSAERRRADDWRAAWEAERKRSDERSEQVRLLLATRGYRS